ncbi:MAG: nucleotidyltransferase family protein [Anaerolineae bacterium]|nr:nucleotidyltransferase family protein [Anaerolineae bacterium]
MHPQKILKQKRRAVLDLTAQYGATNVRIFGSVARGEATEASDIDLLVEFDPDTSLIDHVGLIQDLEDLLGCKVDVVSERGLKDAIRARILRDAVAL